MIAALLVLTPFLPLALALAFVPMRTRSAVAALVPLAPLPALAVALLAEPGFRIPLPEVLLGLELGLEGHRRLLLGFTAVLWLAASVYGRAYIPRNGAQHRYNAFFLVTMGGNLGLIAALDVPGFYLFFSLMTLSSYILVVFDGTPDAYRAGRAYIVLSVLGETSLLLGFLRAVAAAESVLIADIPAALVDGPENGLTLALLFIGFAIKAGQIPLHVWLPLAHPAAPTPASAVLSGAMIKAGLLGMILFLPVGEAGLPEVGRALAVIGLATAFYGVGCGLPQANPKTVLAYSSLSQMGVLVAALGAAVAAPLAAVTVVPAVVLYAVHHGLSKAALFFAVGVVQKSRSRARIALAVAAVSALAIAGLPLTAGALAKLVLKEGLEVGGGPVGGSIVALLPLSALATGLLMLRFLFVLSREAGVKASGSEAGPLLWVPFLAVAALGQVLPWAASLADGPSGGALALSGYGVWESLWPPAAAAVVAWGAVALARRSDRMRLPAIPEGDIVAILPPLRRSTATWLTVYRRAARPLRLRPDLPDFGTEGLSRVVERAERGLLGQASGALVIALVTLGLAIVLVV